MSLSRPSRSNETPESERYYVGRDKPKVKRIWEPGDRHYYERKKQALRLGLNEYDLADEPDFDVRIDHAEENDK